LGWFCHNPVNGGCAKISIMELQLSSKRGGGRKFFAAKQKGEEQDEAQWPEIVLL